MKTPTRMFCQICGHLHKIDFWVPDQIWDEAIHPRYKNTHICLNCFMERADEKLLAWEKEIKFIPCSMATQREIQQSDLIHEIEQLILHAEEDTLDYSVLEHARKLVFRFTHPDEWALSELDKLNKAKDQ